MNKKLIYTLITLMSFSLIGIIWIQIYWIQTSISVKQEQFNQLVTQSLNDVVTDIENKQSIFFLQNQFAPNDSTIVEIDSVVVDSNAILWQKGHFSNDSLSIEIENVIGEVFTEITEGLKMTININEENEFNFKSKLKEIQKILPQDSIHVNGKEVQLNSNTNRIGKFIIKLAKEFTTKGNPLTNFLHQIDLDSTISLKLTNNGIDLPYTYGVMYDDKLVEFFSSTDYQAKEKSYDVDLLKYNITGDPAKLSISFENKGLFIFKSMWFIIVCSVLFTLIIILTFGSTLHHMIKQKKLSDIKNDFINNMTHEFKTPISTISLAVDSITHDKVIGDKEKIRQYSDVIRKENKRMNQQVESVLNTALAERKELELNKSAFNLNDLSSKIADRMALQLEAKGAQLKLTLCKVDLPIFGDEMHLQNALSNLIDNAIKYNNRQPIIEINTSLRSEFCEIKITDNGIGMSAETQKKVFDKFYRAQKGDIHTIKGFGIGLSYVKAIVTAHQGKIELKSKIDRGTTIVIHLPISKVT